MEISDRVCRATTDELFNLVIAVSSRSEFIAGMWTEEIRDGWIFTLKPWQQDAEADTEPGAAESEKEGSVEIRRVSISPPRTRLVCVSYTEAAALFIDELVAAVEKHPAGGKLDGGAI